ncbi:MAG TPA: ABC transporter ATP-binding protein [Gemmatimonadales bacterium]|nr:ABC transporter ATP-binding protein [Gemmatimonadales bacterium]
MAAITLACLTRVFGSVTAVADLSFEVNEGALVGLVGPDGAGKTTTLRMLAGVLRPTSGDAHVGGASVTGDPEALKPHIAYMSQRFGLYPDLTVSENIQFYADVYRVSHAARADRLERLYRFSGLGPFQSRRAGALSGGMKQKLGLCCALIHQPRILLLDEPTFGVDPVSRHELWRFVNEMVAQGVTTLVSTAYLDEAERCDHVALLDHGRLLAFDTPRALQEGLQGTMLEVQVSNARAAMRVLRDLAGVRSAVVVGDVVHVLLAGEEDGWLPGRAALEADGIAVTDVRPILPSLEDVFIERVTSRG